MREGAIFEKPAERNKAHRTQALVRASVLLLLLLLFCGPAEAAWQQTAAGMKYTASNAKGYLTGWQMIDGARYYFSAKGIMKTGWAVINKKAYYFGSNGRMRTGWQVIEKHTYYFGNDGVKRKGWASIATGKDTYRYYFDPSNGRMKTGFVNIGGKRYYLNATGRLQYGFIRLNAKVYYGDPKTGELARSKWINNQYYFQSDYTLSTTAAARGSTVSGGKKPGWVTSGGKKYYYNASGKKVTGWQKISGKYYYFSATGVLQTSCWIKTGGKWYHTGSDGARQYGLVKVGNSYYFLSTKKDGRRLGGWIVSGAKRYRAKKDGSLYHSEWFTISKKRYYALASCDLASGLVSIGGKIYYFDPAKRAMAVNELKKAGGNTYFFGSNGAALTAQWKQLSGKYYYFGKDGKMAKNTVVDGYRIDASGVRGNKVADAAVKKTTTAAKAGWKTTGGVKAYYIDGKPASGWQTIAKKKYYLTGKGVPVTRTQTIGGKKYYFLATGQLAEGMGTLTTADDVGGVLKLYTVDNQGLITAEQTISGSGKGYKVALAAAKYIGSKYVYGGNSLTEGLDCSAFAQQMMKMGAGVTISRSTYTQVADFRKGQGRKIPVKASSLMPGDLIYYHASAGYSHVAVYIGKGMIIHASHSPAYPVGGVKVSNYLNGSTSNAGMLAIRFWS